VRFSDRLRVEWAIEPRAREGLVPGFILQPLVENSLKHGIATRAVAGLVEIAARVIGDTLELSVRDDGGGMSPTTREGVGLWNTRERLRTLYGDKATMNLETTPGQGLRVVVRLPFRSRR
jgi:LytS/YehU family sensor histidine kinase